MKEKAQLIQHPMVIGVQPAVWFDASDSGKIIPGTGNGAAGWSDKGGNGNNVAEAAPAAQPQTGVTTINGRNALLFSGSQKLSGTEFLTISSYTIFAVWQTNVATGGTLCQQRGDSPNQNTDNIFSISTSTNGRFQVQYGAGQQFFTPIASTPNNVPFLSTVILELGTTNSVIRINQTSYPQTGIYTPTVANEIFKIGTFLSFFGWLNGKIAELVIYPVVGNARQIKIIETYLKIKWGV